jgi:hypothetical protein
MSRYRFELADRADDEQLRHVLAATPMAGDISLSFCREPSYFDGAVVEGQLRQVVAARELETNQIVGFGARSLGLRYVNGHSMRVGYLSSLRLLESHRNRGLMARGFAFFRELHEDQLAPFYITTVATTNRLALELLTSSRARLPCYAPHGDYVTFALSMRGCTRRPIAADVEIVSATRADIPEIVQFLALRGPRRQFFPYYSLGDFAVDAETLRGLQIEDVLLAYRGGCLVGMLGAWDQGAFRQTVVRAYSTRLKLARPVYNVWAAATSAPLLPAPGTTLKVLTLALPVVADDDPNVFATLIQTMGKRHRDNGYTSMLVGLHERDPLCRALDGWYATQYRTTLFCVHWSDGAEAVRQLDKRPPYLELGCL